jgi:predicted RNase H-like HicB family nuclease
MAAVARRQARSEDGPARPTPDHSAPQSPAAVQQGIVGGDPQTGRSQLDEGQQMHLTVFIHQDGAEYWSEIAELPGCFASGRTLSELHEALAEAVGLYLWNVPGQIVSGELTPGPGEIDVQPGSETS